MFSRAGSNTRSDSKTKNKIQKSPPRGSSNSKYNAPTRQFNAGSRRAKPDLGALLKNGNPTDFINGAIHEYLLHKEMIESLDVFKNEVNKQGGERRSVELNAESQILEVRKHFFFSFKVSRPLRRVFVNLSLRNGIIMSQFTSDQLMNFAINSNSIFISTLSFIMFIPSAKRTFKETKNMIHLLTDKKFRPLNIILILKDQNLPKLQNLSNFTLYHTSQILCLILLSRMSLPENGSSN